MIFWFVLFQLWVMVAWWTSLTISYPPYDPYHTQCAVPRIAHFVYGIWDHKPLSDTMSDTMKQWKQQGWEVRLWNKEECFALLDEFPVWRRTVQQFMTRPVQQADFFRYLIVYLHGGFYFDLDCIPCHESLLRYIQHRPFEAFFFIENYRSDAWLAETATYSIRAGEPEIREKIANFAFGALPRHTLLYDCLRLAHMRCQEHPQVQDDYGIFYTTGPEITTEVIQSERPFIGHVLHIVHHKRFMNHTCTGTWRHGKDNNPTN